MPKEKHLEFKIGLFTLAAIISLAVFIFSVTDVSIFKGGKYFKVIFGFSNGLRKNSPVRIAGVDEGTVKDIKLFFDRQEGRTKVEVKLWIKEDVKIPIDSIIMVNQLGLMGEKYVEILPGNNNQEFFEEGEILIGKDPIAQEIVSAKIMETAGRLENTIKGVDHIIGNKDNIESIEKTLHNMRMISQGLNDIIYDERFHSIVETLENLSQSSGNLNDILEGVKEGRGTVGKLFSDELLYEDIQGFAADVRKNPWKLLYRPRKDKRKK